MAAQRKILIIRPDGANEIVDRASKKGEYEQLKTLVEGYIERVEFEIPMENGKFYVRECFVNEEGRIHNLRRNAKASFLYGYSDICGVCVVILRKGDQPHKKFFKLEESVS